MAIKTHSKQLILVSNLIIRKLYTINSLFPVISSRLVIIRVSLQAPRKISANSAALLISSSLSSIDFMASLSTDIYVTSK